MVEIPKKRKKPRDVYDQNKHPIVPFDDNKLGIRHSSKDNALPPTEGGYGEELTRRSTGTSSGGFRPTEEEVFDKV